MPDWVCTSSGIIGVQFCGHVVARMPPFARTLIQRFNKLLQGVEALRQRAQLSDIEGIGRLRPRGDVVIWRSLPARPTETVLARVLVDAFPTATELTAEAAELVPTAGRSRADGGVCTEGDAARSRLSRNAESRSHGRGARAISDRRCRSRVVGGGRRSALGRTKRSAVDAARCRSGVCRVRGAQRPQCEGQNAEAPNDGLKRLTLPGERSLASPDAASVNCTVVH